MVPPLADLCRKLIATEMARYPPESFAILSEGEWETIVHIRHKNTRPKQVIGKNSLEGLDGTGRKTPAISDKILRQIEDANPHLADSQLVDEMIWKDCVNYKFKMGGPSRPTELLYPWPILVETLKKLGSDLLGIIKAEKLDISFLMNTIKTLEKTPMDVPLLTESELGKTVKKFIKNCGKLQDQGRSEFGSIWAPRPGGQPTPLDKLEEIIQKWKDMASASGIEVSSSSKTPKKTPATDIQQSTDMRVCRAVRSWRDLHCALCERETKMMANHGARMRKIRQNLETNKHQVKKANIKVSRMRSHREAILDKKKGVGALRAESRKFAGVQAMSKISMLKKETQAHVLRSKTGMATATRKRAFSAFAASCANATGQSKKKPELRSEAPTDYGRRGEIALGSGKRMKMPTKRSDGVFATVAHQLRVRKGNR